MDDNVGAHGGATREDAESHKTRRITSGHTGMRVAASAQMRGPDQRPGTRASWKSFESVMIWSTFDSPASLRVPTLLLATGRCAHLIRMESASILRCRPCALRATAPTLREGFAGASQRTAQYVRATQGRRSAGRCCRRESGEGRRFTGVCRGLPLLAAGHSPTARRGVPTMDILGMRPLHGEADTHAV